MYFTNLESSPVMISASVSIDTDMFVIVVSWQVCICHVHYVNVVKHNNCVILHRLHYLLVV